MRIRSFTIAILMFTFLGSTAFPALAAKGDLAKRSGWDNYGPKRDRPFSEVATITGWCRDVVEDIDRSPMVLGMYRLEKIDGDFIGTFYRKKGQNCVCFDDLAVIPFIQTNVVGERVSISGLVKMEDEEVIMVETMELLRVNFDNKI